MAGNVYPALKNVRPAVLNLEPSSKMNLLLVFFGKILKVNHKMNLTKLKKNLMIIISAIFLLFPSLGIAESDLPSTETTSSDADRYQDLGLGQPDVVIDSVELHTYGTSFYELEEPLALRAGITFLSTGDAASEDWLLIRGLPRDSSRNVLVLLDGMPINNAAYEGVEFHDLPTGLLKRAEVYKPPLPARFGGYHAVINFVLQEQAKTHGATAQAAIASFDTLRGELTGTTGKGPFWAKLGVGFLKTDNLSDVRRTPPLSNLRYEDRSYWDIAPTLFATYNPSPNTSLRLLSLYSRGRKKFSNDEFRDRWFLNSNLALDHQFGEGNSFHVNAFGGVEYYFLNLQMHPDVTRQDRAKMGIRTNTEIKLPFHNSLNVGADFTRNELDEPSGSHSFHTWGAFLEDRFTPTKWFGFTAGLRYDGSDVDKLEFNPSAELRIMPWQGGVLFGRWSRSTRWPSLGEAASAGSDLHGETLQGFTAGVEQKLLRDRLLLKATGFHLRLKDELTTDATTGFYGHDPIASTSRGFEVEVLAEPLQGLHTFASYTFNQVHQAGESIAYGPPHHMATAGVLYSKGPYTARLSMKYLGKKRGIFRHLGQPTTVNDAFIVDLYGARNLGKNFRVFVNLENLANLRYETFQGRPMFPLTILAGLELRVP